MEKTEYKQIIRQIISKYNHKPILEAFNILLKLFNNIINYPRDSKFKNFKKSNSTIRNKILIIDEALSLIYVLGYTKTDDDEILSFNGDYNNLLECVKYLNKKVKELEYEIKNKENSEKKQEEKKIKSTFEEAQIQSKKVLSEKEKILQQIENDKKERAQREKARDSKANDLKYGMHQVVFKPTSNCGGQRR
jgi:hypothetical protein